MILKLDFKSQIPIYQQIADQITEWISTGSLKPGERLPTVRGLAQEAGINSMTVNKAYQQLKAQGYIVTDRRNGAMVNEELKKPGELSCEEKHALRMLVFRSKLAGVSLEHFLALCEEFYRQGDATAASKETLEGEKR